MKLHLAVAWVIETLVAARAENYDVLIRGGRLLDGTGVPWRHADLAVTGDRIAAVGAISITSTSRRNYPRSTRPLPAQNAAPMIGHNAVRTAVLGLENRAPSAAELEKMRALVRTAMQHGAFAFSSGPFYTPENFSKTDELVALARVAAEWGGFYTSHIRDEGDYGIGVVAAVDEIITVTREAKLPGGVTHIKLSVRTCGAPRPKSWCASSSMAARRSLMGK